ncbi:MULTISPECIES: nuclear transport factor 2 family protein [unclassified Myroides]|uniref:nuclear transport factor 2 family protein n=1 Tax=unclassified Myroides TaxID=2642485 RepID=UPI003D2F79CB
MSAQTPPLQHEKKELIKLVEQTFAQGALNQLNVKQMEQGFHPAFNILIPKENEVFKLPLAQWIEIVEAYKNSPEKRSSGIRNLDYTIEVLDLTDRTAVVKAEFFRDKNLLITDYLSYIKFDDSWMAVSKISKEYSINPLHLDL